MPRIARAVAIGYPHHIVQRGNNRQSVFFEEADRDVYFSLLKKYSDKWRSSILAYCLMTNHVHLLVTPKADESLFKMMQGITLCYTQYVNRTYNQTGRLWESRYHSCIVDKEDYLWSVARYIEQNPVRAKMVRKAELYPYSSAEAHILGVRNDLLGDELFSDQQRRDYIAFVREKIPEREINELKYHTRTGRPYGREGFLSKMEKRLDRKLSVMRPGRPKKDAQMLAIMVMGTILKMVSLSEISL
ncbi:MAG: transposase [Nitrospiraceae bacterium]|nr:transposase [Nitrospiraceae bacterium]